MTDEYSMTFMNKVQMCAVDDTLLNSFIYIQVYAKVYFFHTKNIM